MQKRRVSMALRKQERKAMARKAMEKRGNSTPTKGAGFAKLDADAAKLNK